MQLYKYKGYDSDGKKIEGELSANTIDEVERRVSAQSVTVIAIIPAGLAKRAQSSSSETGPKRFRFGGSKVSDADTAVILRDLAVMAETGVPFIEALDAVIATARTPLILSGLKQLKAEIVGGKGLAAGMKASGVFPTIVCEMVKVAEEGGRLDKALASASTYVERSADLKKKVVNAMLYPAVLSMVAVSTIAILIVFVLPRFAGIFTKMGAKVPASTQFLLSVGTTIRSNPIMLVGGLIGFILAVRVALKTPAINRAVHRALLHVPILGELLRRLALSRAFQSIGTLITSNISLLAALEHGARVSGNPIVSDGLLRAKVSVEHGASFSEALSETKIFPPSIVQMVLVGERTGRLPMLMASTAGHMESDVDGRLKALISIVEPIMIVIMGLIVGSITMSIIIPLYSVVENIK